MDQGRPVPQKAPPPVKVVGFHVEGASPSPRPSSMRDALKAGSMSPVMIPPSFQPPTGRTPDASPRHAAAPSGATTFSKGGAATPVSGRRSSETVRSPPKAAVAQAAVSSAPAAVSALGATSQTSPRLASPAQEPAAEKAAAAAAAAAAEPAAQQQRQSGRPQQKEMTKAERRALQEAQRAAKAAAQAAPSGTPSAADKGGRGLQKTLSSSSLSREKGGTDGKASAAPEGAPLRPTSSSAASAAAAAAAPIASSNKPTELFAHLPPHRKVTVETAAERATAAGVPIETVRLGLAMADGSIRGANARCGAMLDMFAAAIAGFRTPPGKSFAREFGAALNSMVSFLVSCRPLSPAMGNVIKAIKAELGRISTNLSLSDSQGRDALAAFVSTFAQEKVAFAQETLARHGAARVADGDVVLTYARSSTVEAVLLAAAAAGARFSVVVVDARPLLEGRALLRRLLAAGIPCEYVLINGVLSALHNATKVILGAAAVASNGAVLARAGTAAVAIAAAGAHIPVMVCAETYKFHDRVQLDSVTYNELGDPAALLPPGHAAAALPPGLSLLNLEYDTTPAECVTVVVTEVGLLPPTSVPVVLREYRSDEGAGRHVGG